MTKKEVSEIFSVMMLAWPSAEMFKGGMEKMSPTISLWATCLSDVDFWTARQAVVGLCRDCKFPPSIAEFREKADEVTKAIRSRVELAWNLMRYRPGLTVESVGRYVESLPDDNTTKIVIMSMGGAESLIVNDFLGPHLSYKRFEDAYFALVKKDSALLGMPQPCLPGKRRSEEA